MSVGEQKELIVREGKPKVYLLVVDSTEEFPIAVEYAAKFVGGSDARIALLNVIQLDHVDHWMNIENRIRKEMREEAERMTWEAARRVIDVCGKFPMVCIEEGVRSDVIVESINKYDNICALILAADSVSSKPGPLVTYFSSAKGLARLNVPLIIVPGHLQKEKPE